jgi:hypothetical protein
MGGRDRLTDRLLVVSSGINPQSHALLTKQRCSACRPAASPDHTARGELSAPPRPEAEVAENPESGTS